MSKRYCSASVCACVCVCVRRVWQARRMDFHICNNWNWTKITMMNSHKYPLCLLCNNNHHNWHQLAMELVLCTTSHNTQRSALSPSPLLPFSLVNKYDMRSVCCCCRCCRCNVVRLYEYIYISIFNNSTMQIKRDCSRAMRQHMQRWCWYGPEREHRGRHKTANYTIAMLWTQRTK